MKTLQDPIGSKILWTAAIGLALGSAACGDDDDDNPMAPVQGTAQVRALHLSPGAPNVDVFLGTNDAAISDLEFREGTGYLQVDAAIYDLAISPLGGTRADAVVNVNGLALEDGLAYTAVAYNTPAVRVLALVDDVSSPEMGMIRVRAVHTAADVGEVDIWNIPATGDPSILYENVALGDVGGYLDLPAGAYTLGFDVDNDAIADLVFSLPALASGTVANVFAVNDGTSVFLVAQLGDGSVVGIDADDPEPVLAQLRAIHVAPGAPASVDVYVNGAETVPDLMFEESTGYLDVPAGSYDIAVAAANTSIGEAFLSVDGLALDADVAYTAVAFNDAVGAAQALALVDNNSAVSTGLIRVRAIHTATGVGEVDIWYLPANADPVPLYTEFNFGDVGAYLDLPTGSYTLGFDLDNDANPDVVFTTPELAGGTIANIFAVNDGTAVYLLAQFENGETARIDAN